MPIKDIKLICHKTKTGKGRTYEKRIAVCVCDHCGKEWDAKRFDVNKPLVFCSRDCVNLSSKNGGKIDDRKRLTYIDRFGVDNPLKSETVQERKRKRCLEKYGVEHVNTQTSGKKSAAKLSTPSLAMKCSSLKCLRRFVLRLFLQNMVLSHL